MQKKLTLPQCLLAMGCDIMGIAAAFFMVGNISVGKFFPASFMLYLIYYIYQLQVTVLGRKK